MNTPKPFPLPILALAIVLASTPILGCADLAPTENTVASYQKAADAGDDAAMVRLGYAYATGKGGLVVDFAKAVEWYRKAAEKGNAVGQANLGVMYANGRGVIQDNLKAVGWFRKAAEQGDASGQVYLGVMYAHGDGLIKDNIKAVEWYHKAAGQGDVTAQFNLAWMYLNGTGVTKNEAAAVEWFRQAAEQGNASAKNSLGVMYLNGVGVVKDEDKAEEWFRQAAAQGNTKAQRNLEEIIAKHPPIAINSMIVTEKKLSIGIGGSKKNVNTLPNSVIGVSTSIDYNKLATQYLKSAKNGDILAKQKLEYLLQTEKIQDSKIKRDAQAVFALPPKIQWLTKPPTQTNQEILELTVSLKDVGTGIGDVRLLINDVAIDQKERGFVRTDSTPTEQRTFTLKLPQGTHKITIEAYNAENLGAKVAKLETTITSTYQKPYKPRLYAVVIGIDQYKNSQLKLNYAVSDAKAIYTKLQNQVGSLYDAGEMILLTDKTQTSKSAIEAAITNISKNIQLGDVFVLYVAGHGINYPRSGYYMLSADTLQTSEDRVKDTSIGREQLQSLIAQVPTNKKLILLDTCNSGRALDASQLITTRSRTGDTGVITGLMQRKSGATVLMASESDEQAIEGYKGHGVFTYAVLEALQGLSDTDKNGYASTDEIKIYVENRVPEITEERFKTVQTPYASISGQGFLFKTN